MNHFSITFNINITTTLIPDTIAIPGGNGIRKVKLIASFVTNSPSHRFQKSASPFLLNPSACLPTTPVFKMRLDLYGRHVTWTLSISRFCWHGWQWYTQRRQILVVTVARRAGKNDVWPWFSLHFPAKWYGDRIWSGKMKGREKWWIKKCKKGGEWFREYQKESREGKGGEGLLRRVREITNEGISWKKHRVHWRA